MFETPAGVTSRSLRGPPTSLSSYGPFTPRETPLRWLESTADQSPAETVAELTELCAEEWAALDDRLRQGGDDRVERPYGPVHWTTLSTHVFWDGRLHDRDVTQPLGISHRSAAVEDGMIALYGLLIASVPAGFKDSPFDVTVGLAADDGRRYWAPVRPGRVALKAADVAPDPDLQGELLPVVEALAGRGPALGAVLHGPQRACEPLTWLRAILLPDP